MLYLVQVIGYTGILYMVYMLLLRNRPMHNFNRAYLLSIIALPVIIPFIKISSFASYWDNNKVLNFRLPEIVVQGAAQKEAVSNTINWVLIGYVAVAVSLLVLFIRKWVLLQRVINRVEGIKEVDYTLLLNTNYGPGSWGKYILLPGDEVDETIIQHEAAHVRLKHSADIVLMNIVQCFFWPNIFLQAIKKELKQVHEFQADAAVGMDRQAYSQLLLSNVFNTCTLPLTHSFIIHPIKRRIMMLKKRKNPFAMAFGAVAIVATAALLFNMVALQSCKAKKWEVYNAKQVDKMAEFNGDYIKFMSENIVYPLEAKDKGIEGKVVVNFVVGEDGTVKDAKVISENYYGTDTNTKVKAESGMLAKAALEVVKKMPLWIPAEKGGKKVAVQLVMPISFKLPNDSSVGSLLSKTDNDLLAFASDNNKNKEKGKKNVTVTEKEFEEAMQVIENYSEQMGKETEKQIENAKKEIELAEKEYDNAKKEIEIEIEKVENDKRVRKTDHGSIGRIDKEEGEVIIKKINTANNANKKIRK